MQVWNVLHMTRWKNGTQKWRKKSLSAHLRTTLSGNIFTTKARIDNRKKPVKQKYLPHMSSNYGEFRPTDGWDPFGSLGTPANFNGFRVLAALMHGTLVVGVSQTLQRWTEGTPIFGRAAITLGIGPDSSHTYTGTESSPIPTSAHRTWQEHIRYGHYLHHTALPSQRWLSSLSLPQRLFSEIHTLVHHLIPADQTWPACQLLLTSKTSMGRVHTSGGPQWNGCHYQPTARVQVKVRTRAWSPIIREAQQS